MKSLQNTDKIEKYSKKKSYNQPLLKEIGKVSETTKGGTPSANLDSGFTSSDPIS